MEMQTIKGGTPMPEERRSPAAQLMSAFAQPILPDVPPRKRSQPRIGEKELQEATMRLMHYKAGKATLDGRITDNEEWWKLRHWKSILRQRGEASREEGHPASAWLFNCLLNKHADAMDNYPEPVLFPRAQDDEQDARRLSSVLPVVLEQCDYESAYDAMWWDKLKAGTGVQGVFWNAQKMNGAGDIDVRTVDLLNLFWEPGVKDIQESRDFFCLAVCSLEDLRNTWGDKVKDVQGGTMLRPADYAHEDNREIGDKCVVVDWYYKKTVNGVRVLHYCKYVEKVLLYASENDAAYAERGYYDHGQYPFVFDPLFPVEDSPAGMGYIDILRDAQTSIDEMNAIILKNARMAGRPRYLVKQSSTINEAEYTDWSRDIVHVEGSLGEEAVRPITVQPLPASVYTLLENKITELKQVSGNDDFNRGSAASGITAASAIAALQEAGSKLSRDMIKASYRAFAKVCTLCVELIRQFYTEPRVFRITGQDGSVQYDAFSSQGMQIRQTEAPFGLAAERKPVFDLKIKSQKSSPFSRIAQNETAKELYQMGAFAPANADQALMVLDMMDFEGKEQVMEKVRSNGAMYQQLQQMQRQMAEMAQIIDGFTGAQLAGNMDRPTAGTAGSGGVTKGRSPLTDAVQGGAGTTATTARDKAQRVAEVQS